MADEAQPDPLALRTRSPGSHFCRKALGVVALLFIASSLLFVIGIIASEDVIAPTKDLNRGANHTRTGFVKRVIESAFRQLTVRLFGDRKRGERVTDMDTAGAHDNHRYFYNGTAHSILWLIGNLSRVFHEADRDRRQYHLPVEDFRPVPSSSNQSSADTTSGAAANQAVGDKAELPPPSAVQSDSSRGQSVKPFNGTAEKRY